MKTFLASVTLSVASTLTDGTFALALAVSSLILLIVFGVRAHMRDKQDTYHKDSLV